jgi:hypothetical protein
MSPKDLRQMVRAQPFRPFRVELSNGAAYLVSHPDMALVTDTALVIGVPGVKNPDDAERFHIVALEHVARLIPDAAAKKESA